MRPGVVRIQVQTLVEEVIALEFNVQPVVAVETVGSTIVDAAVLVVEAVVESGIAQERRTISRSIQV